MIVIPGSAEKIRLIALRLGIPWMFGSVDDSRPVLVPWSRYRGQIRPLEPESFLYPS